jgi:D-sedoheptulose 7-phosphate isomerase
MSATKRVIKGTKPGATHATGPGGRSSGEFARWYREEALCCWENLDLAAVEKLAREVERCEREGRTIWTMGNGGSAATASHLAVDLGKTAHVKGRARIRCVCLNDNAAYMTAIANDLSYDKVFSEQLASLVQKDDLVILITGSGNSPNLLEAARVAKGEGAVVAALLGFDGGKLKAAADLNVLVNSGQYGVIEDFHMSVGHMVTFWLKQRAGA